MKRLTIITTALFNIALFGASVQTHSGPPFPGSVPETAPLHLRSSDLKQYSVQRNFSGKRPSTRSIFVTGEARNAQNREAREARGK